MHINKKIHGVIMNGLQQCTTCNAWKYKSKKDKAEFYIDGRCKKCHNKFVLAPARKKARYKKNKEKRKEYMKQYNIDNREKINKNKRKTQQEWRKKMKKEDYLSYQKNRKKYNLKSKYNITIEQYEQIAANQKGKCKICNKTLLLYRVKEQIGRHESACVDHIKGTKIIRGLLCGPCNFGIGCLQHNTKLLQKAIEYLGIEGMIYE